jgi:hypothetical protein
MLYSFITRNLKHEKEGIDNRSYRSGWIVSCGITPFEGLRGTWPKASEFSFQYSTDRVSL